MKLRITSILLLLFSICSYADVSGSQSLTANRPDDSKINYYLFEDQKTKQSEVLLLVLQGSDCNSVLQIESIFNDYRNIWPQADLLLIEKYGIDKFLTYNSDPERKDCPAEYLKNDNPKQRVADAGIVLESVFESSLETLRKNRKYKHFIVIGGSEGAVVANLLAASNNYVDATIAFNGGGRRFIDDVLHNIASEHENAADAKESIEGFKGLSQHILNSEPFDLEVSGHRYSWWHQMLSIDQYDVLQQVNTPVLIVQGGADLSVSPKKVGELISALRESGKKNIEYFSFDTLDHKFKNTEGQKELDEVISDMNNWLKTILIKTDKSK